MQISCILKWKKPKKVNQIKISNRPNAFGIEYFDKYINALSKCKDFFDHLACKVFNYTYFYK